MSIVVEILYEISNGNLVDFTPPNHTALLGMSPTDTASPFSHALAASWAATPAAQPNPPVPSLTYLVRIIFLTVRVLHAIYYVCDDLPRINLLPDDIYLSDSPYSGF